MIIYISRRDSEKLCYLLTLFYGLNFICYFIIYYPKCFLYLGVMSMIHILKFFCLFLILHVFVCQCGFPGRISRESMDVLMLCSSYLSSFFFFLRKHIFPVLKFFSSLISLTHLFYNLYSRIPIS